MLSWHLRNFLKFFAVLWSQTGELPAVEELTEVLGKPVERRNLRKPSITNMGHTFGHAPRNLDGSDSELISDSDSRANKQRRSSTNQNPKSRLPSSKIQKNHLGNLWVLV